MSLFRRSQRDFEDEIRAHLEIETDQLIAEGHAPVEAAALARRRFGNVGRAQERYYDANPLSWLEDARTDIRFSLRMLRKQPSFCASVIAISGLGLAACITTFSLVSGILLAPLSFPGQDKVFTIELTSSEGPTAAIPVDAYRLLENAPVFDGVAASDPGGALVMSNGNPERMNTALVTASFFRVFRVRPILGRPFTDEDVATKAPVVILSHEEWEHRYGSDPAVLGRTITLDSAPQTIIGVMPKQTLANFEGRRAIPRVWRPFQTFRPALNLVARVADTVTIDHAVRWMQATLHLKVEGWRTRDSLPATPGLRHITDLAFGEVKRPLSILFGAVLLVLGLVTANIATMFLARASAREAELGVRAALGASAGRQFRQLITESLTLTTIGGAIGLTASLLAISVIRALGRSVLPRVDNVGIDWRVAVFAIGAVLLTGCAGGIAHALASRRARFDQAAATTRVTTRRTSSGLVVVQVALSVVLLVGAGLLVKGFMRVVPSNPGFILENRAVIELRLRGRDVVGNDDESARRDLAAILHGIGRIPGVTEVAATSFLPLTGNVAITEVTPNDVEVAARTTAYSNNVTPNYFSLMGIPVTRGRSFVESDRVGVEPVAIINETAAARWWPGLDPIGRRLPFKGIDGPKAVTIVGVVRSSRQFGLQTRMVPELYFPVAQASIGFVSIVAATTVPPQAVFAGMRRAARDVAPRTPANTKELKVIAGDSSGSARFYAVAMALFAGAAILLTGLGIYGLLAFAVTQRRREIGVRIALGASQARIGRTVLARALAISVAGVIIGGVLARGLTRYMEGMLREVTATDGQVFVSAIAGVVLFALIAACAPAWQAARVDPVKTLKT